MLVAKWEEFATLTAPGFAWDGAAYAATRNQALDEESMLGYVAPLAVLLEVAPTGSPPASRWSTAA